MQTRDRLFIGGDWVTPASERTIDVVSPSTEELVGRVPEGVEADVDRAVAAAREAFDHGPWPRTPIAERAELLAALSAQIQGRSQEMAELISSQNGSPVSWSLMAQVFAPTMILDFYAGLGKTFELTDTRPGLMGPVRVVQHPVGVAAAICPWNVPLFISVAKLAPALLAGCTVVLKPAPETPLDSYVLAECLEAVGLPPGVVNIVAAGREVSEYLVTHPGIDKVSFTGSTVAGKRIGALCGERLRRVTLELGGKSAAIILDDANLDDVVTGLMPATVMNNGQACVAQTRILASRDRYDEVVDRVSEAVGALKVGDALDPTTEVGPLVAERQRDRVEGYLRSGREEGARITVGGGRPSGLDKGWYVEPTVFADVKNSMTIAQEEIFGPVLSVIPYEDVDDAVAIANDSTYGLSGSVWGADTETAAAIAARVRTGTSAVNLFMMDFCAPFGGFKQSGIGREFGPEGLTSYLEAQSICLPTQA